MDPLPDEGSPVPRVHPLEIPFVWFGLQLIEYAIVLLLITTFLPDSIHGPVGWALLLVLMVGLAILNYRIRRRFIPR
jgi:drug/metabolite transporter (DMT)-like permease